MGKTSRPLKILTSPELFKLPEIQALVAKGHTVHNQGKDAMSSYDLILGPQCWRMTLELLPYVETAVKTARKIRYGGKGDE